MVRKFFLGFIIIGLISSSCSKVTAVSTPTIYPTGEITPFISQTPKPIIPTATILAQIPETPAPTPTPYLYTVKNDDTMLGIAYQFGISLQDLQAANPTVDPHFMGPGLQLVIPIEGDEPTNLPTATAYPIEITQPVCYPAGDEGVWCVTAIYNDRNISLENLAVWTGLFNSHGEIITNQVAYAPLNVLQPGNTIPLMVYFAPPIPDEFTVHSELLSAISVEPGDPRYISVQVRLDELVINPDGMQALVSGSVLLPTDTPTPSQVWVLAVAYDSEGDILGARKWKSAGETQFEFTVYSLNGMIDHVKVLTEVRP
jgi:LysM repeat protein